MHFLVYILFKYHILFLIPYCLVLSCRIPFSAKEVVELGAGGAYEQYRKFLQLLSYQTCSRAFEGDEQLSWNWMLKCPFHLPYLGALVNAFPDATIVWTHRNPVECIGSACSLYETLMEMAAHEDSINRPALGEAVLQYTEISLSKAMETFSKFNLPTQIDVDDKAEPVSPRPSGASTGLKVIHVRYEDIIKDPKKICRKIVDKVLYIYYAHTYTTTNFISMFSYI